MLRKIVFILIFLLLIPIAKGATPISNCTMISSSGDYYLTQNIIGSYPCISITASGVTLNLNSYSVTDSIYVNTANSVVVENGSANKIYVTNSNDCILQNLTVTGEWIYVSNADPITIKNVEVLDGYIDCFCYGTLENIKIHHSDSYGIVYTALGYYPVGKTTTMKNIWIGRADYGMWIWSGLGDVLDMSDIRIDYTTTYGIEIWHAVNSRFSNIKINYTEYGFKQPPEDWEWWYGALYLDEIQNSVFTGINANPNIVIYRGDGNRFSKSSTTHYILFLWDGTNDTFKYYNKNNIYCGKGTAKCIDYPSEVDWSNCTTNNNHFNDETACPRCTPCDYTILNRNEPSQYVMTGMCLFTNLLVCNTRLFVMAFILILFVGMFLMFKQRLFG